MKKDIPRVGRLLLLALAVVGVSSAVFAESGSGSSGSDDVTVDANIVTTASAVVCPTALTPVACANGKTYRNACEARAAAATDCKQTKFPVTSARGRLVPVASAAGVYCTMQYAPVVCADGKTFGNMCTAKLAGEKSDSCKRIFAEASEATPSVTASGEVEAEDGIFVQASTIKALKADFLKVQVARAEKAAAFDDDVKVAINAEVSANPAFADCVRTPVATAKEAGTPAAVFQCLRMKVQPAIASAAKKACDDEPSETAKDDCHKELKSNLAAYWKFSFSALISQAESFSKYGVSADEITSFTVYVKEQAIAFDKASTTQEKKKIIQDVTDAWKEFRKKVLAAAALQKIEAAGKNIATAVDVLVSIQAKLHEKGILTPRLDEAIVKLQANLKIIQSADASLSDKWVAVVRSRAIINYAKVAAFNYLNNEPVAALVEPTVSVPTEVAVASDVAVAASASGSASADRNSAAAGVAASAQAVVSAVAVAQ